LSRSRQGWRILLRVAGHVPLPPGVLKLVSVLAGRVSLSRLLSVEIPSAGNSIGRLFLVNVSAAGGGARTLSSVARLARQLGPALLAEHETRLLRARARMAERKRIARELHDGVVQSLLGLKIRVHALRRDATQAVSASALDDIERQLHEQVVALRELADSGSTGFEPSQLLKQLANQIERFRRETRIAAVFVCDLEKVQMSSWMCREVVRVVQEALTNIHRHSGAASAQVRVTARGGCLALTIEDDGRGFPFAGRKSLDELELTLQGPVVINERVRALGGALTVESTPMRGSRLEIEIPLPNANAVV
jgi:signal transduction histidine kinase